MLRVKDKGADLDLRQLIEISIEKLHYYPDKPPYAERHVLCYERTGREITPTFLRDDTLILVPYKNKLLSD